MRVHTSWMLVLAACAPALAQTPDRPGVKPVDKGAAQDAPSRREQLLKAVQLPKKADEVRAKGVPPAEMKEALDAAKAKGIRAHEMADLTNVQSKAIDEHGRIDNFGSFVKSKLNEGLRGRELAAAIRAEHAKRGMGPGGSHGKPADAGKGQAGEKPGKPDAADDNKDKPGDKGKGGNGRKGKPGGKGKP
jgi:hypothetical protein